MSPRFLLFINLLKSSVVSFVICGKDCCFKCAQIHAALVKQAKFTAYREGKFEKLNLWARGVKFSRYFLVFTEFPASKFEVRFDVTDLKKASLS